jgi:pilus assembly protein CpaE
MLTIAQLEGDDGQFPASDSFFPPRPDPSRTAAPRGRMPRITIHAFCETADVTSALQAAAADRAMSNANLQIHWGRPSAALNVLREAPADLVILESKGDSASIMEELELLADVCSSGVRVMVIGHQNDVALYRELIRQGVSEYLVAPIDPVSVITAICEIHADPAAEVLGRSFAFIGAKGGVGSSTIAHNLAWAVADLGAGAILADMDVPFGTAALDFNLEPAHGIAEAVEGIERLDDVLLERLLTRCGDRLDLLAAPGRLDAGADFELDASERLLRVAQAASPFLILDVPHVWAPWVKSVLTTTDEVVITAIPDLANLRNAKNIMAFLQDARPDQPPPKLLLNQVGVPKRPEIKASDFAEALQVEPVASLSFEPNLFGTAANNGQMIAQTSPKSPSAKAFAALARELTGRTAPKRRRNAVPGIGPLLRLLRR